MKKILLVEDDPSLGSSLLDYLAKEGLEVSLAQTLERARSEIKTRPDLIVLDWMLPDGQGIDWLREIRAQGTKVPVILLTARNELVDKVAGLETGANDYLTKPFEPRELVARIRVQLRSHEGKGTSEKPIICAGPVRIDLEAHQAYFDNAHVELTKMEFSLLRLFCENPGKAFTRDDLLNKVWGFERFPTTRTVDTHILQLRQKFGEQLFETLRGIGYRMKV